MKHFFRKALSLVLTATLASALAVPAAASDAMGDDLTSKDALLNQETQLSTNVFWSTAFSDLRTENLVTYTPNDDVTPMITYGSVLTDRSTVSAMARTLESQGYRVVAGINGDFYNTATGLPIGLVVTEGQLRSTDGGYYAVGFRADGTAVLGRPTVSVTADLGYDLLDEAGTPTEVVRQIAGVNKARVSTGGIYLYTYDFNARHTTGNTEAGVDVLCTIQDGVLSIGDTLTLTVDQVLEATSATAIGPDQIVLSANLQSPSFSVDALRRVLLGSTITVSVSASDEAWNDVDYAVGALYSLVENGGVVSGLPSGVNPRTAVGQKADGSLVFYTIDGRRSGHSIGASMTQLAQRMIELGCETALCLDGGGSTAITVTQPTDTTAKTINTPSDGSERAVTNQIFLVASSQPTGRLSHFYVSPEAQYVLAGSKVTISAAAVDTNFIPMDHDYDLDATGGDLDGHVLTTPSRGGEITVTAESRNRSGSTTVYAIAEPDSITVRNSSGAVATSLTVAPGASAALVASAVYRHMALKADPEAFTWTVDGDIGAISATGLFTAYAPGSGSITVSAGGKSVTVPVTVSSLALKPLEDFEGTSTIFRGSGNGMDFSLNHTADTVRLGRGSARVDYSLTEAPNYSAEWRSAVQTNLDPHVYTSLNLWVYGDNSGNQLDLLYSNGDKGFLSMPVTTLDFSGWKQVSVALSGESFGLQGLQITAPRAILSDDGTNIVWDAPATALTGTVYIDHVVASFSGTVDNDVPVVAAALDSGAGQVIGTVSDAVDGVLPKSSVTVSYNGAAQDFTYDAATGAVALSLPGLGEAHEAMRVTITAQDASGNIGRASVDVEAYGVDHKFTDINDYWAATFVDFLYNEGITTGYSDGTFRPGQNITRAQFAVMLYRYLGLEESAYASVTLPFADNGSIPEYAVPAVRALYTEGIINGSTGSDGRMYFNPGNSLTRAQAATMIGRTQAKGYATAQLTFTDTAAIPAYATYYIQTMVAQGIIGGYTDGSFQPHANITRGQMAKILYNLL